MLMSMSSTMGLREQKKQRTQRTLWLVATDMFAERGFDAVSVAEVAAAADVSKTTVFNYVQDKEDLVLAPMRAHVGALAGIVRDRAPGESVVAALQRQFLAALDERDASTGLNDTPKVLSVQRLIQNTPRLLQRAHAINHQAEELLAAELTTQDGEFDLIAHAAAAQITAVRNMLIGQNIRRLLDGVGAEQVHPIAIANARAAFGLLEHGLAQYPKGW
jgi:AcrR family transcriptional regulator